MDKFAKLTYTGKMFAGAYAGLKIFELDLIKNGQKVGSMEVVSGLPYHQALRKDVDSISGCKEPIPEGEWELGDHDSFDQPNEAGVNFAGEISDFETLHAGIESPIWTGIHRPSSRTGNKMAPRMSMGVHLDNPNGSPGTLGCIGLLSINDCKRWWNWNQGHRITRLVVDYKLGTFKPKAEEKKEKVTLEIVGHSGRLRLRLGSEPFREADSIHIRADYSEAA